MTKLKTIFVCSACRYESPRWTWQCSNCKKWNTLVEDVQDINIDNNIIIKDYKVHTLWWRFSSTSDFKRITTGIDEFDRVLGWGFVSDSIVLFTWNPWIWKSTLTMQVCWMLSRQWIDVLYISWEESISQIENRWKRLFKDKLPSIKLVNLSDLDTILDIIEKEKPWFVVIDSVNILSMQWVSWTAGSITQIKATTEAIMHFIKKQWIPILLIGQVTKDWEMAWPQALAHLVDAVIHFEWDRYTSLRILRWTKNRFWTTSEIWIFEMEELWLVEVKNPSEILLANRSEDRSWTSITVTVEWTRPFLIEIQSLLSYTNFTYPKRVANGIDANRLNILLAVLQKYMNIKMTEFDVFVNAVWWFKLSEPAIDLAICSSIISSKFNRSLPVKTLYLWEIWLSWEIRQISFLDKRLQEAEKLGFENVIMWYSKKIPKTKLNIKIIKSITELS